MATKQGRTKQKPAATPAAPLNLRLNRRTRRRAKKLLLGDDELARALGEEFVRSVTGAQHAAAAVRDEEVPEEHGGPFVTTDAAEEFALDVDESNPVDAEPAALPTVSPLKPKP